MRDGQRSKDGRESGEQIVRQALERCAEVFSPRHVDRLRESSGYNPRQRKATARRLLLVCVEACLSGYTLGFATLRGFFVKRFGRIRPRAFQLRFKSAEAVEFFRQALQHLVSEVVDDLVPDLRGPLSVFSDVLVYDGSGQRVPPRGRKQGLKATTADSAGSKWVIGYSLRSGIAFEGRPDSATCSEIGAWRQLVGSIRPGALYLLDLGFFCRELYERMLESQAHLLMRLKACNHLRDKLRVVGGLEKDQPWKPRKEYSVATYLRRANRYRIRRFDLDVEWGMGRSALPLRVVGVFRDKSWYLYLTTVPREVLSVEDVVATYRLRWLIEFLFREWKQVFDWGRSATADRHALFTLGYASLLAHALVRSLRLAAAVEHEVPLESLRPSACLHVARAFASELVSALLQATHAWLLVCHRFLRALLDVAHEPRPSRSRPRIAASLGARGG